MGRTGVINRPASCTLFTRAHELQSAREDQMRGKSERGAPRGAMVGVGLAAAFGLALAACGGGQTTVMAPPAQPMKVSAITLLEGKAMVSCPQEIMSELHEKLTAKLYKPGAFGKGPNVKLAYRVVDYNASDAARVSFGSVTGQAKGSLAVEAVYLYKSRKGLRKIRSEGKVGRTPRRKSIRDPIEHLADRGACYTA